MHLFEVHGILFDERRDINIMKISKDDRVVGIVIFIVILIALVYVAHSHRVTRDNKELINKYIENHYINNEAFNYTCITEGTTISRDGDKTYIYSAEIVYIDRENENIVIFLKERNKRIYVYTEKK